MKVTLICNSDKTGGAAIVTSRLMNALRRAGVDARMIVASKLSDDPNISFAGDRQQRSWAFLREHAGIFMNNGFSRSNLFKVSPARHGIDLASDPEVRDADIIVLSWVFQGLLSLRGIERIAALGKPVVWLMHDMWCLTGICHHAGDCDGWRHTCGSCPLLHSHNPADLSHKVWEKKRRLYDKYPFTFVAVSNWLADKCRQSTLLRDRRVEVIPNAVPVDSFSLDTHAEMEVSLIDYSKKIILMGAARLDDPIKGLDYAIDALNILFLNHPELSSTTRAVFFGAVRDKSAFDRLNFPFTHVGVINDPKVLREFYAAASVVVSTSLYETLPGTLIEGQASGCIPVTFDHGGQRDIVEHLKTGYIARYRDPASVADGILWALQQPLDPKALRESVRERFSSSVIAARFIDLLNSLLENKKKPQ